MTIYPASYKMINNRRVATYPNQKIVSINKIKIAKNDLYFYGNHEATRTAMKILTHGGLRLWLYLNMNQPNYEMALSPIDVQDKTGLSVATYKRAIVELVNKKYLIRRNESSNEYDFYEKVILISDRSDTTQCDTNHTQTDTIKECQIDGQQYQLDRQSYQDEHYTSQFDTTNITQITNKTDTTNNITGSDVFDDSSMDKENTSYTGSLNRVLQLYEIPKRLYSSYIDFFLETVLEYNIDEEDIPDLIDMWIDEYDSLYSERSEDIKFPYRYEIHKVCNMFLDEPAKNEVGAYWEANERYYKKEKEREEKRWNEMCEQTLEELSVFKLIFEAYEMNKNDIQNNSYEFKRLVEKYKVEKSEWSSFTTYWLNEFINEKEDNLNKNEFNEDLKDALDGFTWERRHDSLPY